MAMGVVNVLEIIQIKDQHGVVFSAPFGLCLRLLQPIQKQGPIGQSGQGIVMGQLFDHGRGAFLFRNISEAQQYAARGIVRHCRWRAGDKQGFFLA